MLIGRFRALCIAGLVALCAVPAFAFVPQEDSTVFEIPLPDVELLQNPRALPAVDEATDLMTSRYGGSWHVYLWNPASHSPQAVYGSGVELASSPLASDAMAEQVATSFVASNPEILGARAADLEVEHVVRGNGKVAVHFAQRFHGLPVLGGRVRTIFAESGRLSVFGSTFYRDIDVSPVPLVSAIEAEAIARNALRFNPATDQVLSAPELMILPVPRPGNGADYHLVWRTTIGTADPYGAWVTHVDAHDREIVWRMNDVHFLYSGTSQGDVDQSGYCDGQFTSPFRNMYVDVSGLPRATTEPDGNFSVTGTGGDRAITAQFDGPHCNVNDVQFGDAIFNGTIQENVPLTIDWTDATPSRRAERDAFYWTNETDAFIKSIDPAWSVPKHDANVNVDATCNANWSTWRMNFFREGGGCANTATIGDVVAHEYGHGIQYSLLGTQGPEGLGEGNSDISASFQSDDSVIGRGFRLDCGVGIRNCLNTLRYPEDVIGQQIHYAGQVICGFNWDTRVLMEAKLGQAAGEEYTANLWHFARKLYLPLSQPDQVFAYFLEDDDDMNPGNGTPNFEELCEAAENHGFECPPPDSGVIITHTPLGDTMSPGPYTVSAAISTFGAHPLNTDSPTLYYAVNGGAFASVPLVNAGGEIWEAEIPDQGQGSVIGYYLTAENSIGLAGWAPPDAPDAYYLFAVGSFTLTFEDDIEEERGWTIGEAASSGTWERADPNGTFVPFVGFPANPEDDHTADPGVQCWVTGNPPPGSHFSVAQLDGRTSLLSPVFDLSGANAVRGSVWLWAYFQFIDPADYLELSVSTDGGSTWSALVRLDALPPPSGLNAWNEYRFEMTSFGYAFTSEVQFRLTAEDAGTVGVVDCALDDFLVTTLFSGPAAVSDPAAQRPVSFVLHPSQPNPFNPSTQIRYELPRSDRVKLSIFDVSGRELRVLVDERKEAGAHAASWDGTDASGRALSSGVYFYRLETGSFTETRRMTLLK